MTPRAQRSLPIAASTGMVAEATGLSGTSIRRLVRTDPTFPRPFTLSERGDLKWPLAEIVSWLEAKAGRPLAS